MIKVAIIGAGFFGLHLSNALKSALKDKIRVDIYESSNKPMSAASANNQCRLHLGYHYPRSGYTIYQSLNGSSEFIREYGTCIKPIKNNYYLLNRDGLVNRDQYLAVMDSFDLKYKKIKSIPEFVLNQKKINLAILTEESYIDLNLLRKFVLERQREPVKLLHEINGIDPSKGLLYSNGERFGPYDLVINCTYRNPNLGLEQDRFQLKYELAAMVLAETNLTANEAITIMDGPFISVYPASERFHTLSSVVHTPFIEFLDVFEFEKAYENRFELASAMRVDEKIISHIKQSLNISINNCDIWVTGKTKLATAKGDSRETLLKRNNRVVSILCGKLDAVYQASAGVMGVLHEFI